MNEETYKALKRIVEFAKDRCKGIIFDGTSSSYQKEVAGNIKQVEEWIDETAKEYVDDEKFGRHLGEALE